MRHKVIVISVFLPITKKASIFVSQKRIKMKKNITEWSTYTVAGKQAQRDLNKLELLVHGTINYLTPEEVKDLNALAKQLEYGSIIEKYIQSYNNIVKKYYSKGFLRPNYFYPNTVIPCPLPIYSLIDVDDVELNLSCLMVEILREVLSGLGIEAMYILQPEEHELLIRMTHDVETKKVLIKKDFMSFQMLRAKYVDNLGRLKHKYKNSMKMS